jgi:large conductance mechanosensitive channel
MSLFKEFKAFALRGNVVDMAIGIIIGAGFSKIVNSLVNDMIMPPLGFLLGGVDFSDLSIVIKKAAETSPAVTLNYGMFINTVINFIIIAFSIFLMIKLINTLYKEKILGNKAKCPECLMEIPINAKRCPHCTSKLV